MRLTMKMFQTVSTAIPYIVFASIVLFSNAHQSISYPTPVSFDLACRIGLGRNCPGPCPTHLLRKDQSPNRPAVTTRRGGVLRVHILKNNHVGGFARWSLVPVNDMYSKSKHAEAAFLFTCADVEVTKCTKENQERDCKVDRLNEYYRYNLRIPKVYPDGYYVLGWLWYGGLVSTGTHGAFGEYWDCVYVKIKGGPRELEHQPTFHVGQTMTGQDGMCRATTNRVGHCFREPCPFGNRPGVLMKPVEFERSQPSRIKWKDFESDNSNQYQTTSEGDHENVERKDSQGNANHVQEHKPSKTVSKPRPGNSQTAIVKSNDWVPVTGNSNNRLQSHGLEKVEDFKGNTLDASKNTGTEKELRKIADHRPMKKKMTTASSNKPGLDAKKVAKQRRLRKKRLRKERKLQKREEKQARKANARAEKLERKRLMREEIKQKRVKKRKRQKIRKQRMTEMKKISKQ